jgi:hypothetical protein
MHSIPTSRSSVAGLAAPLLCALALLLAAQPATATEAGANIRRSPGESAAFTLAGTNGYTLHFTSEKGLLEIVVSQERPAQATISPTGKLIPADTSGNTRESIYFLRGVSRDLSTISADLGPAGSVDLVFQPSGEREVTRFNLHGKSEKCVGAAKVVRRLGSFVGSVSFHGENGYTSAAATSVPGTIGTSPFRNCTTLPRHQGRDEAEEPARSPEEAFLSATGTVSFLALHNAEESRFNALSGETLGPDMSVLRVVTAVAGPRLFSYDRDGGRAAVRPPAPFSGSARYRASRGGTPTWTGNLSVDFPRVVQPLTEPGSDVRLKIFGVGMGR